MLDLDDAFDRLAPEVDLPASRDLFDQRRALAGPAGNRRRAVLVAAAAALVLVLGIAAIAVAVGDGQTTVQTADDPEPSVPPTTVGDGPIAFDLLAMDHSTTEPMGTLRAATDADELTTLWTATGFDGAVPDVDLDRWVVVSTTIPDDACPPELTAFDRAGEVVTPVFVEPAGGCNEPLIPKTYVAAVDRASVSPRFTLRLPAYEYFFDEKTLVVDVPPTSSGDPAPPTSGSPPSTVAESPRLGTVDLPAVGTTGSGVLDDGSPVWVVHHADGSVSVLPALVRSTDVAPPVSDAGRPGPDVLTGALEITMAFGDSGFRSHSSTGIRGAAPSPVRARSTSPATPATSWATGWR